MKNVYIILATVCISILSINVTSASYIWDLMEFDVGPEAFEINTQNVENMSFENPAVQNKFNEYKKVASSLKTALLTSYANGELGYYQMQGMITNYNNFIYYTNKFFYYISEKEKYPSEKELSNAILRNYKFSRVYFLKLQNLYNTKK